MKVSLGSVRRLLATTVVLCSENLFVSARSQGVGEPVPLAERVVVEVPGGRATIALPRGLCRYPAEVVNRVQRFELGQRVLLAGGTCSDIATLMRTGKSIVDFSVQINILDQELDPAKRSSSADYLSHCKDGLPSKTNPSELREAASALARETPMTSDASVPLGLLPSQKDAAISGILSLTTRPPDQVFQLQILACLAPAGVPLMWLFQKAVQKTPDNADTIRELEDMRNVALDVIAKTSALNAN